jgi:tetratricopeptide (TPR) repeat protein
MAFDDYKEEETNISTKKIHELAKKGSGEMAHGLDHKKTHEEIIKLYNKIPEKDKTGEQTRCAVAALILLNKINEARLLLDKWRDIGKDDKQWNIQYGWTYYLEQNYKDTIPYFNRVEDLDPKGTTMLDYLRECNEKVGNVEEAKRIKNWIREIDTLKDTGDKYSKINYYKNK